MFIFYQALDWLLRMGFCAVVSCGPTSRLWGTNLYICIRCYICSIPTVMMACPLFGLVRGTRATRGERVPATLPFIVNIRLFQSLVRKDRSFIFLLFRICVECVLGVPLLKICWTQEHFNKSMNYPQVIAYTWRRLKRDAQTRVKYDVSYNSVEIVPRMLDFHPR